MFKAYSWLAIIGVVALQQTVLGDDPINLKNFTPPGPNRKDEPLAKQFSLEKAVDFLDASTLDWTKRQRCFTCHTNYPYLYARPMVSAEAPAHLDVRKALEEMVSTEWVKGRPRWDAEVVATAAALAFNDSLTTKKLHPLTKTALDRMWTVQRKDGSINWLNCGWPPFELDEHYGVTLALIGAGVAPEGYADTKAAKIGLTKLRIWLENHAPANLHHRGMLLWAASYLDDIVTADERKATIKDIFAKQLGDGGWSGAGLGNWKCADKLEQDFNTSDGYGTGFAVFVLRRGGVAADDPAIQKGIAWLKANQRESGRWFARSLNRDGRHFLTHAGSAFAVMAIQSCEPPAIAK